MVDVLAPLLIGEFTASTVVGAVGGVVVAVGMVVMCGLALAPLSSSYWAEQFGVDDVTSAGPDPADVIDGRTDPVPATEQPSIDAELPAEDAEETSRPAPTPAE